MHSISPSNYMFNVEWNSQSQQLERRGIKRPFEGKTPQGNLKVPRWTINIRNYPVQMNIRTLTPVYVEQQITQLRSQIQRTPQAEIQLEQLCALLVRYGYTVDYVEAIHTISAIEAFAKLGKCGLLDLFRLGLKDVKR